MSRLLAFLAPLVLLLGLLGLAALRGRVAHMLVKDRYGEPERGE
jgi:hypothetical protein